MNNPETARILEHIRYLSEIIGPRPAGSLAEKKALDYAAQKLTTWGYPIDQQPASFAPQPVISFAFPLVGIWLIAACLLLPVFPALALLSPLWIGLLPALTRFEDRLRPRTGKTENVYAQTGRSEELPTLILAAHVDTARIFPFKNRFLLGLYSRTLFLSQRIAIFTALIALLILAGAPISPIAIRFTQVIGGISALWFLGSDLISQFGHKNQYSRGANDNASGVALALALAERFSDKPPAGLVLGFLFTGAEETGMHGAESYARLLRSGPTEQTAVISLDMVGAGDYLNVVVQEGTLLSRKTTGWLNQKILATRPGVKPVWYGIKSGDFSPFLSLGIPATGLQRSGGYPAHLRYHTAYDTLDGIQPPALADTLDFLVEFISNYQNRSNPEEI